jgi:type I restriction enzyme M protein
MISKLDVSHGIAGFLLANGALNDPDEYENRKRLIENDKIEAIIVLPRDMFYTVPISCTMWIVNMNKKAGNWHGRNLRDRTGETLFVDLRTWNSNVEEIVIDKGKKKKKIVLSDSQISSIKELYSNWQSAESNKYTDVAEFCHSASIDEIRANDYSLLPSKYIEFIDHDLDIDFPSEMSRIQEEMRGVMKREKQSQAMLEDAFRGIGYGID